MKNNTTLVATVSPPQPDLSDELATVLDRYVQSLDEGTPLSIDNLADKYPHLADEIRSYTTSIHLLHDATAALRSDRPILDASSAATRRLGDFDMLHEIGRGGMGIVYEARQISLDRRVALKVLPFASVLDAKRIARFKSEAQTAAGLHHPHIVPVFAVGQERGMHFYAMQLIEGRSLENVLEERRRQQPTNSRAAVETAVANKTERDVRLAAQPISHASHTQPSYLRAIAELGVQAAEALQHAHEYGVLHRDIKPSNLLLDQAGTLWVTDFGLARIRDNPSMTVTGDVVGTLRYMSPEQSAGDAARVDPGTDIYALGVTLYELLTLKPAHPGETRAEVQWSIQNEKLTAPRQINPAIPVALETIVLKAAAKPREQRYATARQFAEDLQRFLDGKPILARRPTLVDRATLWIANHGCAAVAAGLVLVLLAGLSTTGLMLLAREQDRTKTALVEAEQNYQRAQRYFQQAQSTVDRFGSRLSDELTLLPGSEPIRRALLVDTLAYYRKFIDQAENDSQLQTDLANTLAKAGAAASRLGATDDAVAAYRDAITEFAQLENQAPQQTAALDTHHVVAAPADPTAQPSPPSRDFFQSQQAVCWNKLGLLLANQGQSQSAEDAFFQALRIARQLVQRHPEQVDFQRSLAEAYSNLGLLAKRSGHLGEAREALAHAIQLQQALVDRNPDLGVLSHDLAISYNNLSSAQQQSDPQSALDSCREAIAILKNLSLLANNGPACWSDLALCHNNFGAIQSHLGQYDTACRSYRQAIEIQQQLHRRHPAVVSYRSELAISWNNLGQSLTRLNRWTDAAHAYENANQELTVMVADHPHELAYRSSLAAVLNNQALVAEKADQIEDALAAYEMAIEHQQHALDAAPRVERYRQFLGKHLFNYERALHMAERTADAQAVQLRRSQLLSNSAGTNRKRNG